MGNECKCLSSSGAQAQVDLRTTNQTEQLNTHKKVPENREELAKTYIIDVNKEEVITNKQDESNIEDKEADEEVDIDLNDPDVQKASLMIQVLSLLFYFFLSNQISAHSEVNKQEQN